MLSNESQSDMTDNGFVVAVQYVVPEPNKSLEIVDSVISGSCHKSETKEEEYNKLDPVVRRTSNTGEIPTSQPTHSRSSKESVRDVVPEPNKSLEIVDSVISGSCHKSETKEEEYNKLDPVVRRTSNSGEIPTSQPTHSRSSKESVRDAVARILELDDFGSSNRDLSKPNLQRANTDRKRRKTKSINLNRSTSSPGSNPSPSLLSLASTASVSALVGFLCRGLKLNSTSTSPII